ncbi:MAG: PEP-CTERM sorting domain-containing protein [Planctomycetota bacterium]
MKKKEVRTSTLIGGLAVILIMTTSVWAVSPPVTVATFDDPAASGSTPLFVVNLETEIISGLWLSVYENLDLEIPIAGAGTVYEDVRFVMDDVTITSVSSPMFGTKTEDGIISFYENDSAVDALVEITFDSAWITYGGFGASDFYADDNVTISGSQISGTLNGGSFSFAFANHQPVEGDWNNGFAATAAFTSSIPEPVTVMLLGLGGLLVINKKK